MDYELQPGDIFLTRDTGLLAKAIRFFTRRIGEKRSKVNHVGVVVKVGGLKEATVVEALSRVREHPLWSRYGPPSKSKVVVFRPVNLSDDQIAKVVTYARQQVGRKYGVLKLLAHLGDWGLQGARVFRRLTRSKRYPICSWLVAYSFDEVGVRFGTKPWAADPDDIWDHVRSSEEFEEVFDLMTLKEPLNAED